MRNWGKTPIKSRCSILVCKLNVIIHYYVRNHHLCSHCRVESPRATNTNQQVITNEQKKWASLPGLPDCSPIRKHPTRMTEPQFACGCTLHRSRKSEAIELGGIWIVFLVVHNLFLWKADKIASRDRATIGKFERMIHDSVWECDYTHLSDVWEAKGQK